MCVCVCVFVVLFCSFGGIPERVLSFRFGDHNVMLPGTTARMPATRAARRSTDAIVARLPLCNHIAQMNVALKK